MKLRNTALFLIALTGALFGAPGASAEIPIDLKFSTTLTASSGEFSPYYIVSNNHGVVTSAYDEAVRASIEHRLDSTARFSYAFGADVIARYASSVDYKQFDVKDGAWHNNPQRPAPVLLQQLYVDLKYRSLFLSIGMKERGSAMLDSELSSGDLTFSGNTRPIAQVRMGFHDFVDIPLTHGWLQLNGVFAFGVPTDSRWVRNHYNYHSGIYNTGWLYNYKRVYFRTNPSQPLSATFGMQAAGQFGGTTHTYANGVLESEQHNPAGVKEFFKMIIPGGGERYYYGNHVGSWDMKLRWRFNSGATVAAYFEWPWEDGSGIAKKNGFDGLWGVEYHSAKPWWISGAVVEYLDFTNQSGPLHWDPSDHPGSTLPAHTDGNDNYYNNFLQNGYAYYGMSIGTPMLRSPIYNLDGQMQFLCNRVRGFHTGIKGDLSPSVSYRVLFSYRKGWGTRMKPIMGGLTDTSAMLELKVALPRVAGLSFKGAVAIDRGSMYGNNFGALLSACYNLHK